MPYAPHYRCIWVIVQDSYNQNQHQHHYMATSSAPPPPPNKWSKSGPAYHVGGIHANTCHTHGGVSVPEVLSELSGEGECGSRGGLLMPGEGMSYVLGEGVSYTLGEDKSTLGKGRGRAISPFIPAKSSCDLSASVLSADGWGEGLGGGWIQEREVRWMSNSHVVIVASQIEEELRTVWVVERNSWLLAKTEDIVDAKVPARFVRHDGMKKHK